MFEPDDTGYRVRLTLSRGNIVSADDSKMMQTVTFRGLQNEMLTAERFQSYGHTSVPVPPSDGAGLKAPEVVVGFIAGDRSHPVVVATDDRSFRPKNMKPGEVATYDHQGQIHKIANDGIYSTAKQHVITAGDKPDTSSQELNEQLKGLAARTAHLEHTSHGLFDFMSQLNTIAMTKIPALSALAPVLNQAPNGLTMMTQAIAGKELSYLQVHLQDTLAKFLTPNIGGVGSVLSGGIEGLIAAATAQIASVLSANPVVAQVDGLVDELANLNASGSPAVVAEMAPVIRGLIDSATASNPVVGQVAQLRSALAGLLGSAGPGINFLAPQQRLVQGLSKALKLAQ